MIREEYERNTKKYSDKIISICIVFYPWSDLFYRGNEIYEVLITSMNQADNNECLELVVVDAGVEDVYKKKFAKQRVHNKIEAFLKAMDVWHGSLQWIVDNTLITSKKRFHFSRGMSIAVDASVGDYLLLTGMDITIPKNFVELYHRFVQEGKCWVPHCYRIMKGMEWRVYTEPEYQNMYVGRYKARGIVGVTKKNYYDVGGYRSQFIFSKSDSDFFSRCAANLTVEENNCPGMLHVNHYGGHSYKRANFIWTFDQLKKRIESSKKERMKT